MKANIIRSVDDKNPEAVLSSITNIGQALFPLLKKASSLSEFFGQKKRTLVIVVI